MPEVLVSPTVYTAGQLHTRNRRRQFVTTDGRFMLRADGTSGFSYWHDITRKDGKTVVGTPIKGPEQEFYTFFSKEHALAVLNKICAHYGY